MQHLAQGNLLLRQGKAQEAVEIGTSLIQAYPGDARVFSFLAEACRVKGDLEAAIVWIDQAIQASPDSQFKIKKAWLLSRLLRRDEDYYERPEQPCDDG